MLFLATLVFAWTCAMHAQVEVTGVDAESEEEERQSEQEIPEVTVLSRIDQYHCHKEHRPNEIRDIE